MCRQGLHHSLAAGGFALPHSGSVPQGPGLLCAWAAAGPGLRATGHGTRLASAENNTKAQGLFVCRPRQAAGQSVCACCGGLAAPQGKFLVVQVSVEPVGIRSLNVLVRVLPAKNHMNSAVKGVGKIKSRKEVMMNVLQGFARNLVIFHMRTKPRKKKNLIR